MRISDVIGKHVALTPQGREFKGRSPFTGEIGFFVSDEKARWFDLSTRRNGTLADFLVGVVGMTREAAEVEAASLLRGSHEGTC